MDIPVFFTSDLTSAERKVSLQWSLEYLKKRLELTTGIDPAHQTLQHYPNKECNQYRELHGADDATTLLGEFDIEPFCRIHVADGDPESKLAQLKDDDGVEGFELTEEAYEKRQHSVLQWKKDHKLGRYDDRFQSAVESAYERDLQKAQSMREGDRCRIINIEGERRGVVKYVGAIPALDEGKGVWVGVAFDEPVGKNDGLIGSVRLFSAKPNHGSFVRPSKVDVGDYPELDPFASDDEL